MKISWLEKITDTLSFDRRSLTAFRVGLGMIAIFHVLFILPTASIFLTDTGVAPRSLVLDHLDSPWIFSAYFMNGTYAFVLFLMLLTIFSAAMMTLGIHTRFFTFVTWLLLVSLYNRTPAITFAGDQIIRLIFFWALFMPLDHVTIFPDSSAQKKKENPNYFSIAILGYSPQVCMMYWFSVVIKLREPHWVDGQAVSMIMKVHANLTPLGALLGKAPLPVLKFLTYETLVLEILGPLLLVIPIKTGRLRFYAVALLLFMHTAFATFIRLGIFPWIDVVTMIPFLPGWFWDQCGGLMRKKSSGLCDRFDFFRRRFAAQLEFLRWHGPAIKMPGYLNVIPWRKTGTAFLALLIPFLIWWNLATIPTKYKIPQSLWGIGYGLNLEQRWGMFTPPGYYTGWPMMIGKTVQNTEVNLFEPGKPIVWEKRKLGERIYPTLIWRYYWSTLIGREKTYYRKPFVDYVCREWNETHGQGAQKLNEVQIYYPYYYFYPTEQPLKRWYVHQQACQ